MVTRGWNGYRNKSQHRKSTLEKKILPPFQQGFEPATFQSRVRRSNHWAIPAPIESWVLSKQNNCNNGNKKVKSLVCTVWLRVWEQVGHVYNFSLKLWDYIVVNSNRSIPTAHSWQTFRMKQFNPLPFNRLTKLVCSFWWSWTWTGSVLALSRVTSSCSFTLQNINCKYVAINRVPSYIGSGYCLYYSHQVLGQSTNYATPLWHYWHSENIEIIWCPLRRKSP